MSTKTDITQILRELRHGMRERLMSSPACDGPTLARSMESFYQRVLHASPGNPSSMGPDTIHGAGYNF